MPEEGSPPPARRKPSQLGGTGCALLVVGIVLSVLSEQNPVLGIVVILIGAAILLYAWFTGKLVSPR
jgi:hypothetical protein